MLRVEGMFPPHARSPTADPCMVGPAGAVGAGRTAGAGAAISTPNAAVMPSPPRKLRWSAVMPITGGPMREPRYPVVVTAVMAEPAARSDARPAALYTTGSTLASTKPISVKPTPTAIGGPPY